MRKLILSVLFLNAAIGSAREADYIFYNQFQNVVNSAAIGAEANHTIGTHLRYQRTESASSDSPQQQTFNTTHRPSNHVSTGAPVVREKVSVQHQTALLAGSAYALPLIETDNLYLGIEAGGNLSNIDSSRFKIYNDQYDPYLQGVPGRFQPNVGIGAHHQQPHFYVGLSVPNLLASDKTKIENEVVTPVVERISSYAQVGHFYPLAAGFILSPRAQAYINQKGDYQLNALAAVLYSDYAEAALGYRSDSAASVCMLSEVLKYHLSVGYGFETSADNNVGTSARDFHEFMLKVYW